MKIKSYAIIAFVSVILGYVVYLGWLFFENGYPAGFGEFGTLGDAFGTLNSLFSGLGFAGIVVTLLVQQYQIKEQEKENVQQDLRYQNDQYENTLHRYLMLYKQVLSEVTFAEEIDRLSGRDILNISVRKAMDSVRTHSTSFFPRELRERAIAGKLTQEDREIKQFIFYEHHRLIKSNVAWQGRLIQTAHLLFRHLEEKSPAGYDIISARELVMSQMTHIECHYFFLICLSTKKVSRMAMHMANSIFLIKHSKFRMSEIERELFETTYKVQLNIGASREKYFIDAGTVKKLRKKKKLLQAKYRTMINNESKDK